MSRAGVSIVIPVFENGAKLFPVVSTLVFTIKRNFEIILVYDQDDDITLPTIDEIILRNKNIIKLKNKFGNGPISGIKTGLECAKYEYFMIWMSYHLDPEGKINGMLDLLDQGADLVSANRFSSPLSHGRGMILKKAMSKLGNFLLSLSVESFLSDFTTSIKVFRTSRLKEINKNFYFDFTGWSIIPFWTLQFISANYRVMQVEFTKDNLHFIYGKSNFNILKSVKGYLNCILFAMSLRFPFIFRKKINSNQRLNKECP